MANHLRKLTTATTAKMKKNRKGKGQLVYLTGQLLSIGFALLFIF
jgi:hypothetical protein